MRAGSPALWYASRATGVVCLLLMTTVILLGLLVARQWRLPGLPRFGVVQLHRYLSVLTVCFVAVHVLTAVAQPYPRPNRPQGLAGCALACLRFLAGGRRARHWHRPRPT
jgi:predicted ferric reductase